MFLNDSPLCFDCGRGATLVHHIKPISDGGERLDFDNMMSLCVPCHGKRHGARAEG
jgi:5-methylcytosine-specific restriction endonuclease McrA